MPIPPHSAPYSPISLYSPIPPISPYLPIDALFLRIGGWSASARCGGGVGVGRFVDEVEELVEFWGDDDLGATVLLTSGSGGVGGYGVVFTSAACSESGGVNAEVVLQRLHHGGCAKRGEIPVVADIGAPSDYTSCW